MNFWPPKPGSTVITRISSTLSMKGSTALAGVLGLTTTPAFLPLAWILSMAAMDVLLGVRLHMAGDDVRAGVAELLHIAHGTLDHQVDIQRQVGGGADGLDHRDADGDIGHEQAVHHVHMDVVGGGDFFECPAPDRQNRRTGWRGRSLSWVHLPFAPQRAAGIFKILYHRYTRDCKARKICLFCEFSIKGLYLCRLFL